MNIQPFNFQGHQVRVVQGVDGQPLWIAIDVAKILGYRETRDMTRNLDVDESAPHNLRVRSESGVEQQREMTVITESGLYSAILRSRKPEAKEFKRWVTGEVLPAIRKHGGYLTEQKIAEALDDPDTIIRLATSLKEERARRTELETQQKIDAPKVIFADAVAVSNTAILVGDLAKLLKGNGINVGANRLFGWLRENGYLIRRKGTDWNMPTQKSMDLELLRVKETVITHSDGHTSINKTPKVTGKGQRYFVERFLDGRFNINTAA